MSTTFDHADQDFGRQPRSAETGDDLVNTAKQDLRDLGDKVQGEVTHLQQEAVSQLGEVTEKAKGLAAEQKDLLSEHLGGLADALQKVAGELATSNSGTAGYARVVADGASKLSDTVKNNDVDAIIDIAQRFGREQPVAFMGAAALLGFAASRFALASSTRQQTGSGATPNTNAGGNIG